MWCVCEREKATLSLFQSLQEQLLLEPMFEVPGSDITRVQVEEDTARGYHPARYHHKDPSSGEGEERDRPASETAVDHTTPSPDSAPEIKTSVL